MLNKIRAAADKGGIWLAIALLTLGLAVVYLRPDVPVVGTPPATVEKKVLPTTGEQGYPVLEFCKDSDTKVYGPMVAPPDSTFAASFQLIRVESGVREQIDVNVYADLEKQPVGTHYDSSNKNSDAFVSKEAMSCIVAKAVPPVR